MVRTCFLSMVLLLFSSGTLAQGGNLPETVGPQGLTQLIESLESAQHALGEENCKALTEKLNRDIYDVPSDHFAPRSFSEKKWLSANGPDLVQRLFQARLSYFEKARQFTDPSLTPSDSCLPELRNFSLFYRFGEEILIEYLHQNFGRKAKKIRSFDSSYTRTVDGRRLQFMAGDVILSRGPDAYSSIPQRIVNEEGYFSHTSLVVEDGEGNLFVAEAEFDPGVIMTPLSEWLKKTLFVRAAVYRHRSPEAARQVARSTYDWLESLHRKRQIIRYDFAFDESDESRLFCSEFVRLSYERYAGELYGKRFTKIRSKMDLMVGSGFYEALGAKSPVIFSPNDIEFVSDLNLIADFVKPSHSAIARIEDSIVVALFDWMKSKQYWFSLDHLALKVLSEMALFLRRQELYGVRSFHEETPRSVLKALIGLMGSVSEIKSKILPVNSLILKHKGVSLTCKDVMAITDHIREMACLNNRRAVLINELFRNRTGECAPAWAAIRRKQYDELNLVVKRNMVPSWFSPRPANNDYIGLWIRDVTVATGP